jgi:hypothetical protein
MRQTIKIYTQPEDKQGNHNDSINLLNYMKTAVQSIADSTAKIKIKIKIKILKKYVIRVEDGHVPKVRTEICLSVK